MKLKVNHYASKIVEGSFKSEFESIAVTLLTAIVCTVLSWYAFNGQLAHLLFFTGIVAIGMWVVLFVELFYTVKGYIERRRDSESDT